jgi:membrane associated rhomboid family serine protease
LVVVLWLLEALFVFSGVRAVWLGIIPRTVAGLPGIIFSPFIHGNYEHLLANSMPLLVVGSGLIYFYGDIAWKVLRMIWLFTGFWVWLAARQEAHIGASGLIYGLVCFLFLSGILRKDTRLLAVSLLVTFLYGSMVWGILPVNQTISWESHLFGSVAGFFCAIYFRDLGPQRQKTQWEIEEELGITEEVQPEFSTTIDEMPVESSPEIKINYELIVKKPEENESQNRKMNDGD